MEKKERDVRQLIERILSSDRMRSSSHFSERVYGDEPILTTGSAMSTYLPERYRQMREISRWEPNPKGTGPGRWLSAGELFHKQAVFMADWEDNCPYRGTFKSLNPAYASLSDKQLRGYFTWRAATRSGDVQQAPDAFALLHAYELLGCIGVDSPREAFGRLRALNRAWAAHSSVLEDLMETWLIDFAARYQLEADLIADLPSIRHEYLLSEMEEALVQAGESIPDWKVRGTGCWRYPRIDYDLTRRKPLRGGIPPLGENVEWRLFDIACELSPSRLKESPLYHSHPRELAHIVCATLLRLADHYYGTRRQRLLEGYFGDRMKVSHTLFSGALFWDESAPKMLTYDASPLRKLTYSFGCWSEDSVFGYPGTSDELGSHLQFIDERLRAALGIETPEGRTFADKGAPAYLEKIVDREIKAELERESVPAPVKVDVDLSMLAAIRAAAASTREALLIDEEREDGPDTPQTADAVSSTEETANEADRPAADDALTPQGEPPSPTDRDTGDIQPEDSPLTGAKAAYLAALSRGDAAAMERALTESGLSQDMMVDAINEALFDALGDTAIEFDSGEPRIVEDYEEELEEILSHAR